MERVLRRLRERADQYEHERDRDRRAGRPGAGSELTESRRARLRPDEHEPAEHGQATGACDEQRMQRRGACPRVGVLDADEEERRDRRQLPEGIEDEEVVGLDEADHGAAEEHQHARQPSDVRRVGSEVARRVEEDEDADAADDQGHRRGEPVQSQVERQVERADPRDARREDAPVDHISQPRRQPSDGQGAGERADEEGAAAEAGAEGDEENSDQRVHRNDRDHGGGLSRSIGRKTPGMVAGTVP